MKTADGKWELAATAETSESRSAIQLNKIKRAAALSGGYQSPRIPRRSSRSSLSSSDSGGVYTILLLGRNKPRTKRLADTRNLGMGSTVPMDRIVGKQAVDLRSRTGRHP